MLYFVHGLNGSAQNWVGFIRYFIKQGFQCEAIQLGQGLDLKKTHLIDYVEKVQSYVSKDDVVIGHSMGGLIMQKVAEQTLIKAGIGICSAPPAGIIMNGITWWRQFRYIPYVLFGIPFKPSFSLVKDIFLTDMNNQMQQKIYQKLQKQSAHVTFEVMKQKITVNEKRISCPLYFIGKINDATIPIEVTKKIATKYDAPYDLIKGNHYIYHNWHETADLVLSFLKKIDNS
jgi:pimeloyl-ACP methyl ester carboxylesterase